MTTRTFRPLRPDRAIPIVALIAALACGPAGAVLPPPEPAAERAAEAPSADAGASDMPVVTQADPLAGPHSGTPPSGSAPWPVAGATLLAAASLGADERASVAAVRTRVAGAGAMVVPVATAAPAVPRPPSRSGPPMTGWGVFGSLALAFWIALRRSG